MPRFHWRSVATPPEPSTPLPASPASSQTPQRPMGGRGQQAAQQDTQQERQQTPPPAGSLYIPYMPDNFLDDTEGTDESTLYDSYRAYGVYGAYNEQDTHRTEDDREDEDGEDESQSNPLGTFGTHGAAPLRSAAHQIADAIARRFTRWAVILFVLIVCVGVLAGAASLTYSIFHLHLQPHTSQQGPSPHALSQTTPTSGVTSATPHSYATPPGKPPATATAAPTPTDLLPTPTVTPTASAPFYTGLVTLSNPSALYLTGHIQVSGIRCENYGSGPVCLGGTSGWVCIKLNGQPTSDGWWAVDLAPSSSVTLSCVVDTQGFTNVSIPAHAFEYTTQGGDLTTTVYVDNAHAFTPASSD